MIKASEPKGFLRQYWAHLCRYFGVGLLVWVPLIITIWLSWLVIHKVGFGIEGLIKNFVFFINRIGTQVEWLRFLASIHYHPGLGFLTTILLFLTTGFLTRYWVGRKIISYGESLLNRIPFISRVYRSVQQVRDVIVNREGAVFQEVCLVEYPRPGMLAVALITAKEQGFVQQALGKELLAVFVPTTPNPTSGYLVYMPPSDIIKIDISVEEAMKLIISGGAYSSYRRPESTSTEPV